MNIPRGLFRILTDYKLDLTKGIPRRMAEERTNRFITWEKVAGPQLNTDLNVRQSGIPFLLPLNRLSVFKAEVVPQARRPWGHTVVLFHNSYQTYTMKTGWK